VERAKTGCILKLMITGKSFIVQSDKTRLRRIRLLHTVFHQKNKKGIQFHFILIFLTHSHNKCKM